MLALYVIISGFFMAVIDAAGVNFTYDRPGDWYKDSKKCGQQNKDEKQSPIDILPLEAIYEELEPLVFDGLEANAKFNIDFTPDGSGFTLTAADQKRFLWKKSKVNGLPHDFRLLQFHFHTPSEHTIDGTLSPLEIHLVHANAELVDRLERGVIDSVVDVMAHKSGLAVYGIMFEIGPKGTTNKFVDGLLKAINKIKADLVDPEVITDDPNAKHPNAKHKIELPHMSGLFPEDATTHYYTYPGSLTTPPCYESVQWFVAKTKPLISLDQFIEINRVHATSINNRPVQPLNPTVRHLTRTFKLSEIGLSDKDGSEMVATSIWIYLFLVISIVLV